MWHSKVARQTFSVDLIGITLTESCKLITRWAEGIRLLGKSLLIFSRQVEGVRRHQLRKNFGQLPRKQSLLHFFGALRNHTIGKDIHHFIAQCFIPSGSAQKLLAALLI